MDAQTVAAITSVVITFGGIVVGLVIWLVRMRSDVDSVKTAVTNHKDDCSERYEQLAATFTKVEQTMETHRQETRQDVVGLHRKLDELTRLLVRLGHVP